jgi:hypothetical protein
MARKRADFGVNYGGAYYSSSGPEIVQTESILMDADTTGEFLAVDAAMAWVNTFSIALWFKSSTVSDTGTNTIFAVKGVPGAWNTINISGVFNTPVHLKILINDKDDAAIQNHTWNNVIDTNWHHAVFTWDGTDSGLVLHYDGATLAPSSTANAAAGTNRTTANQRLNAGGNSGGAGNRFKGNMYSIACYDKVVTEAEAAAMYNEGNGQDFDLQNDSGDYESSANLQDYYRFGLGDDHTDYGSNRGLNTSTQDMTNSEVDASDLVTDAPTG